MKRSILVNVAVAAAVLSLGLVQTARASLQLKIVTGTGITTNVLDNGVGDSNPVIGQIQFAGSVGAFSAVITSGISNAPGSTTGAILQTQSISVRDNGAQAGTLTLSLTDNGFTSPVGPGMILGSAFAGTFLSGNAGEHVTFQSFASPTNILFGETIGATIQSSTLAAGSPFPASFSTPDRALAFSGAAPYAVTNVTFLSLTAGGQVNLAGTTTVTPAGGAVPEPASLSLLGLGVAALFARRRRA